MIHTLKHAKNLIEEDLELKNANIFVITLSYHVDILELIKQFFPIIYTTT